MKYTETEEYKEIQIMEKEREINNDKKEIAKDALKIVGTTAVTAGSLTALCFLVPDIYRSFTSDEAITFAAVTLLRLKEAGVTISLIGAAAGLYGSYVFGDLLKTDKKILEKDKKELANLKR